MYISDSGSCRIGAIRAVEVSFKVQNLSQALSRVGTDLLVKLVYVDPKSGATFGTCDAKDQLLSDQTFEAFTKFLESAEEDFGKIVFGSGRLITGMPSAEAPGKAETLLGLGGS